MRAFRFENASNPHFCAVAVVLTVAYRVEVSRHLRKGEELGYFAFGGSDFVIIFEQRSNVSLASHRGVHVRQGMPVGKAYPA